MSAAELCAFIRANRDSPELIERALSNPGVLAKIKYGFQLIDVIYALNGASRSDLIPRVLTDEILAKIKCVLGLKGVIGALNGASRSDLIPRVLTAEILAKINGFELPYVIDVLNGASRSDLIPLVLTAEILAKIENGFQLAYVIGLLNDASHIAIVLGSEVIRRNFSAVCDPRFAYNYKPDLKALVVEALDINARWSPLRSAWTRAVVLGGHLRAARAMGAGATAGGAGASAAATDPAPAPGSPDGRP
jgi:hypothetical protein